MPEKKPIEASCPTCGKLVVWTREARWRPFCSERCRLIDLGDWLDEAHRISDPIDEYTDGDLEPPDDAPTNHN
jgi:endogenous inhibitor of DNA gyrase (YacG/DUF329 family)